MKTASPEFIERLKRGTTTLARLWEVTPHGRDTLYFTDHQRRITYASNVYRANTPFTATAVQNSIGGGEENVDVNVILTDDVISYRDVERGIYDNAAVSLSLIDYKAVSAGVLPLFVGRVNQVSLPLLNLAQFALRGSRGRMIKELNETYTATCRADFGDERCGVNTEPYSHISVVTSVAAGRRFSGDLGGAAEGQYRLGTLIFVSGANLGVTIEIADNTLTDIITMFGLPFPVEVGDQFLIIQGCPRTLAACTAYGNLPNYRGEPYVPGEDFVNTPARM